MSDLKLGLLFLVKAIGFTVYTVLVLFTAVSQAWITTTLLIFLPLFGYYFNTFMKIKEMRRKLTESEEKVSELMDKILKSKEKLDDRDDKDE